MRISTIGETRRLVSGAEGSGVRKITVAKGKSRCRLLFEISGLGRRVKEASWSDVGEYDRPRHVW